MEAAHDAAGGFTGGMAEMLVRTTTAIFVQEVCSAMIEPYVSRILAACRMRHGDTLHRVTFAAVRFVLVVWLFHLLRWVARLPQPKIFGGVL
jgi:hypothetical protein